MDENPDQNLIRLKVDATGVDLSVGRSLPELLGRLLPSKFLIRRSVDQAIASRILDKIRGNADLEEAEVSFAEGLFSDQARKFIRLKQVQQRAQSLVEESQSTLLIEAGTGPNSADTSDDWVNKFREDASLVDDDLIREIYARVVSEEAQRPKAFSLRTLGVLRYLDREAATAFGQLQKVLIGGAFVPQQSPNKDHILNAVGLNHSTMLMLEDAGLVSSSAQSQYPIEGNVVFIFFSGHSRLIAVRRTDGANVDAKIPVHLLTPAGQQLARIADCEPDEAAFAAMLSWLRSQLGGTEFEVATSPSRNWKGKADELHWQPVIADSES